MKTMKIALSVIVCGSLLASCDMDGSNDPMADKNQNVFEDDNTIADRGDDGLMDMKDERPFIDWDDDGNGLLSAEEFKDGFGNDDIFNDLDANNDGLIDNNEFGDGMFDRLDTDGDGLLSDNELTDRNTIFDDEPGANLADWDMDGNKEVDRKEFKQLFKGDEDNFSKWDDDNNDKLNPDEVADGAFDNMDDNNDGSISKEEFKDYFAVR